MTEVWFIFKVISIKGRAFNMFLLIKNQLMDKGWLELYIILLDLGYKHIILKSIVHLLFIILLLGTFL